MTRQYRIGVDVGKYDHAQLCAFAYRRQRFHRVRQEIPRIGMYLYLQPVEASGLADLGDAHSLVCVTCAGRVEHHLHLAAVDGLQDVVSRRIAFVYARQSDRYKLRLACGERGSRLFA